MYLIRRSALFLVLTALVSAAASAQQQATRYLTFGTGAVGRKPAISAAHRNSSSRHPRDFAAHRKVASVCWWNAGRRFAPRAYGR
jgi:hypothetical protein